MGNDDSSRVNRRHFLATAAVSGVVALAGCSSGGNGSSGENGSSGGTTGGSSGGTAASTASGTSMEGTTQGMAGTTSGETSMEGTTEGMGETTSSGTSMEGTTQEMGETTSSGTSMESTTQGMAGTTSGETSMGSNTTQGTNATSGSGGSETIAPGTTLEFGGEVAGWMGNAPDAISGTTNPTLTLQEGAQYTFRWTNEDGQPHNVIIEDSAGSNQFVNTEIISSGSQEVQFTAQSGMSTYYCQVHPSSMRGTVEVV